MAYTHRLKTVDRSSSAISLNSYYTKDRSRGILRKESTDYDTKPLSPETLYRRFSYLRDNENKAYDKCERWKIGLCNCEKQ